MKASWCFAGNFLFYRGAVSNQGGMGDSEDPALLAQDNCCRNAEGAEIDTGLAGDPLKCGGCVTLFQK
jgi:hypothetical protein